MSSPFGFFCCWGFWGFGVWVVLVLVRSVT
jgi:hypothetical protein